MTHFLDLIFSSFWHFVGGIIFIALTYKFISLMWNSFWRHWTIRKHGWPPDYCDADGSFDNI